jgi:hypothetical protein
MDSGHARANEIKSSDVLAAAARSLGAVTTMASKMHLAMGIFNLYRELFHYGRIFLFFFLFF